MKIKNIFHSVLTAIVLAGLLTACASEQTKQARLQAQAKVSQADAEKIALAKVPNGTLKEPGELEKEHGKLIWSFDIATPGTADITEVGVNAITGEVVSVEKETPKHEEKEKKEDSEKK